ncbi:YybH family protein [Laspinema olomoucense]|uniref:YybH family protein n=1 Tax=Laspinema olomoucense TaxID=3231600 RepID=UPI0021BB0B85|nr:nuclear transport factor 2 family protein [Laspinema sp. D3a]MCT7990327.1 nuclear transport factor 2 family protein [Laspinema sp. D3a]
MKTPQQPRKFRGSLLFGTALLALSIAFTLPDSALGQPVNEQELQKILQTRQIALDALNNRDFSSIEPYLHPSFTITTVDNQVFHTVNEFETYWNEQFNGPIERLNMSLEGETIRTFLSPEIEVASGEALSTFYFRDGNEETMPLRWTAVLQKVQNTWTIQSLHFSANFLDNPVLNYTEKRGNTIAIGTSVAGVLVGALLMFLLRRYMR